VPCIPLAEAGKLTRGPLLLSLKLSDGSTSDLVLARRHLDELRASGAGFDLFLHAYGFTPEARAYARAARRVFAGNAEMAWMLASDDIDAVTLWCPALVDAGGVRAHDLELFSFGMAHKIRLDDYVRLRELLEASGTDYGLTVSTAFHEKASFGAIDRTVDGIARIFGERVTLLGFLSDPAVRHFLRRAHLFVAFFPEGVRANNTSVLAAMAAGRPALTDLDAFSPPWMRHGVNVLDLAHTTPEDLSPATLRLLGERARADAEEHAGWAALADRLAAEAVTAGEEGSEAAAPGTC
jgi:hypothetical protein